jgi:hypothetical protein
MTDCNRVPSTHVPLISGPGALSLAARRLPLFCLSTWSPGDVESMSAPWLWRTLANLSRSPLPIASCRASSPVSVVR